MILIPFVLLIIIICVKIINFYISYNLSQERIVKVNLINKPRLGIRSYSTSSYNKPEPSAFLDPNWVTGFVDAEGSFTVSIYEDKSRKLGWNIICRFKILLHQRDELLLKRIQEFFNAGTIYKQGDSKLSFEVNSVKVLNDVIIPHFEKYGLITQKRVDFELFKQIVFIKANNKILSPEDFELILKLKANLNKGFTEKLIESFPHIICEPKPIFTNQVIPHPQWLTGLIDGEGCFIIKSQAGTSSDKNTSYVGLTFSITQSIRDNLLLENIIKYLNCGYLVKKSCQTVIDLKVGKLDDILTNILPFLKEYPLQSVKQHEFQDWVKACIIIKNKEHLTPEGIEKILKIKNGMNKKRISG